MIEDEVVVGEGEGDIRGVVHVDNIDDPESVDADTASLTSGTLGGSVDISFGEGVNESPAVIVRAEAGQSFGECEGEGVVGRDCCGDGIPDDGDLMPIADEDARWRRGRRGTASSSIIPSTTCVRVLAASVSRSKRRRTLFNASPCSRASRSCSSVSASFMRSVATILLAWRMRHEHR